jgi:hypothetical protein
MVDHVDTLAAVKAQGWYADPYERHQDRYYSDGRPTALVRDGAVEAQDPPPADRPPLQPVAPTLASLEPERPASEYATLGEMAGADHYMVSNGGPRSAAARRDREIYDETDWSGDLYPR